jgi:hypothetical protein
MSGLFGKSGCDKGNLTLSDGPVDRESKLATHGQSEFRILPLPVGRGEPPPLAGDGTATGDQKRRRAVGQQWRRQWKERRTADECAVRRSSGDRGGHACKRHRSLTEDRVSNGGVKRARQ